MQHTMSCDVLPHTATCYALRHPSAATPVYRVLSELFELTSCSSKLLRQVRSKQLVISIPGRPVFNTVSTWKEADPLHYIQVLARLQIETQILRKENGGGTTPTCHPCNQQPHQQSRNHISFRVIKEEGLAVEHQIAKLSLPSYVLALD